MAKQEYTIGDNWFLLKEQQNERQDTKGKQ